MNGRLKSGDGKLALDVACESGALDSLYLLFIRAIEDSTITFPERLGSRKRPRQYEMAI